MRVGVISDVHSNHHALRRALEELRCAGADIYVCVGDVVGYGAQPNECIATLAELEAVVVAGNHDLMVLDALADEHESDLVKASNTWTRGRLGRDSREYLAGLPMLATIGPLVVTHGSFESPECYVSRASAIDEQLDHLRRHYPDATGLVLGHTHRPMLHDASRHERPRGSSTFRLGHTPALVNPGSVGQSREFELRPLVRFALIDLDDGAVTYFATPYDARAARETLRREHLSRAALHLVPGRYAGKARDIRQRALRMVRLLK